MAEPLSQTEIASLSRGVGGTPWHLTYVDVFEGLVEVEGLMPSSPHILIKPGFSSRVDRDRAPEEPREANPGERNEREGQNPGADRSPDDQRNQPRQTPPNQGSEGKPD